MPQGHRATAATCGNLTRFDVVATRRTKAFHHYSVGGGLPVESSELPDGEIESVTCRWCSTGSGVVVVDDPRPDPSCG
ncbi:MAG: hypothetical protein IPH38_11070 [Candidatus Microthrix sp.]|nr:hypothetical protein [Candidatus Microthrix sp.]